MTHLDENQRESKGSCSNDYVRSWLEKTQRRPTWESAMEGPQDTEVPWRPHDLETVDTEMLPQRSFSRKHRRESPDSSIIPDRPRRGDHRPSRPETSNRHSPPRQCRGRDARTRPRSSATMSPVPSRYEPGRFERRARHKTRPDRYETRKQKPAQNGDDKPKARRTKTQEKKKLVSSREVMDNFTSDAILTHGRLTVKPALTPGLYGNARCGSPNEMPDLAYNSMGFLAHTKRRDDPPKQSDRELREDRKKRRAMRESSPLFVQRSESCASSEYSRDRDMTDSHVWQRFGKNSPATIRPNTAPMDIATTYEPLERKPRYRSRRAPSSVETENNLVPDSSPLRGAVSPPGEPESHNTAISESRKRRLWQTGVFNGTERANTSTPDNHQRSKKRRVGTVSPRYQKRETGVEKKCSRVQCADKSTMITSDGVSDDPAFSAGSHAAPIPEQADSFRKTAGSSVPGDVSRAPVASLPHLRSHGLLTAREDAHATKCAAPVDRNKIAFMAHIPVYSHQESQTDSPWPPLQPAKYAEVGTQTAAPLSPQHCQRFQTSSNTSHSPYQRHGAPGELLVSEEPLADDGSPGWVLDERNQATFRNPRLDVQEEAIFGLAVEYPQAHPEPLEQMALEMQRSACAGRDELEQTAPLPYHRDGHGAPVLDFTEPKESDTFDEEGLSYSWEYGGHPLESQAADFETIEDGTGPIYRHVDQETKSYHPYPIRYRTDTVAALQPSTRRGPAVNSPTSRIPGEELCVYPQGIQYLPEQQPPRCPRPGIRSRVQNDILPCVRSMAGHAQDENRVNIRRPSYLPAYQRQTILDDLEQERAEAYWWSKQFEFPRRYGY